MVRTRVKRARLSAMAARKPATAASGPCAASSANENAGGAIDIRSVRTLDDYYARLDAGALPCFRGWQLSADDRSRRDVIQALMCKFTVDFAAIEAAHGIVFDESFAVELASLRPLADDGLVEIQPDRITVTPSGRLLVRTIAMTFDRFLRNDRERARYSRVI